MIDFLRKGRSKFGVVSPATRAVGIEDKIKLPVDKTRSFSKFAAQGKTVLFCKNMKEFFEITFGKAIRPSLEKMGMRFQDASIYRVINKNECICWIE